ncbi:MAG: hypothetical protein E7627_07725 [Ruminococcaceae bacterium]|nr:hypothetical protein [Oscillospiraceae bacterium]
MIRKAETPNIDAIFENGITARKATAEAPAYTPQNIGSMLHGVTRDKHRITDRVIESYTYYHDSDYPSVFKVLRRAYPDADLALFATYGDIAAGVIEADIGVHTDTADTDELLSEKVVSYLAENDPKLLFIQYQEAEDEGPATGYGKTAQINKIGEIDGYIGQVYEAIKSGGLEENTLFIVTSDHFGMNNYNGGSDNGSLNIYFGITGQTVDTDCKIKEMEIRDIASVITYALGLDEQPAGWTSMVPNGLFIGMPEAERPTGEVPEVPDDVVELDTSALLDTSDGTDIYDRVIIFGVDGAGTYFKDANTPYINAIFGTGAMTFEANTVLPSISAHSWTSLMHGVTPDIHGVTNSTADGNPYDPKSPYPSIFRLAREAFPDAALASFCTWNTINVGIVEDGFGVHKDTADNDDALTEKIVAYLDENDPKIMYIQFDIADVYGHATGFGSEWQRYQIGVVDGYIGQIYNKMAEEGLLKNTLFIITPDHGGTPYGYAEHGGDSPDELTIMYGVAGKTVVPGGKITSLDEEGNPAPASIMDTAAIVAYALGLDAPESWTATVPGDLFRGVEATPRPKHTIFYDVDHRDNASVPTPENGVADILGERVKFYLPFDGNTADKFGNTVIEDGELVYEDGFFGQALNVKDGSAEIEAFAPGNQSFSVAFWFKTPLHKHSKNVVDPCLLANKSWSGGELPGFILYTFYEFEGGRDYNDYYLGFNLGNGDSRMDEQAKLPSDWQDGWVHVILSVDRATETVSIIYDFGRANTFEIPEEMKGVSLDGECGLVIGQDSSKEYEALPGTFDELIIIGGAVTEADVAALAEYYGIK